ncbi:hypothetical protein PHYBOEH_011181 [Phytophthora boehmeriae]|uniref:Uncharacterized protein n=1 Tax=Phytophthora boehmeriae TaxID=109152 RepID=A0A8T1X3Z1_9STRA|nr:hypothetical protein PHYBOEH_011181 [Phytophthora boehmeriae]
MTGLSQEEEDDDERLALERELAAELAAMSVDDAGMDINYDTTDSVHCDYVRLDLEEVLQRATQVSAGGFVSENDNSEGESSAATSWDLLLQSVDRNEREFFQLYHNDLNDIRASILDVKPSMQSPQPQTKIDPDEKQSNQLDHAVDRESVENVIAGSDPTDSPPPVHDNDEQHDDKVAHGDKQITNDETSSSAAPDADAASNASGVSANFQEFYGDEVPISTTTSSSEASPTLMTIEATASSFTLLSKEHEPPVITAQEIPSSDRSGEKGLEVIAKLHAVRESRRLKTQARREKERNDAVRLLRQLQKDLEAQEQDAEEARRAANERSLMAIEEAFGRRFAAAEREAHESGLMVLADEASQEYEASLARVQAAISREICQMAAEDQAERRRMQAEKKILHMQQLSLARSHFGMVLVELTKYHQVQRQLSDQEMKRELRECVQMRAEEAYARRVIAEMRAFHEQQTRESNRSLMVYEDELSRALEVAAREEQRKCEERRHEECCRELMECEERRTRYALAYNETLQNVQKQREERSRLSMELEEIRCRHSWTYLAQKAQALAQEREAQRSRFLSNVSTGVCAIEVMYQHHELIVCLGRWKWWNAQCADEEKARENAATRIQMWHRSRRLCLHQVVSADSPLVLEDMSEDGEEPQEEEPGYGDDADILMTENNLAECTASQDAARRLQSRFRGFHVRRKFASALALAQAVDNQDESDAFDVVDLDDLIELPPELVDGWEDPVLPQVSFVRRESPLVHQPNSCEEERVEHIDDEGDVERDNNVESNGKPHAPVVQTPVSRVKEQSLAATLWSKMSRSRQKQQHSQQERQRQLDPVYRVQKLLNRKSGVRGNPSSSHNNNQSSHSRSQTPQGGQKIANMITWSSSSNAKKRPKVKLPSLVERLRRQTMDER